MLVPPAAGEEARLDAVVRLPHNEELTLEDLEDHRDTSEETAYR
jgi:hypothetical protein